MLFAADFWKTKDSSQWTSDEVNKLLTDSPWAKEKTIAPQGAGQRRGMGRRGGFGFPGGGLGGGYPGGGGGYPGGGGGYPGGGGGGYPSGGSGGGTNASPMNLTIRWESATPVVAALKRQNSLSADESKALADATPKDYVIALLGYRLPQQRNGYGNSDDQNTSSNGQSNQSNDRLRSQFIDAAQLNPKGKSSIYAEDVQFEGPNGSDAIRYLFPRSKVIVTGDKEVEFIFEMRGIKVDEKFKLSDMEYEGQLAL